MLEILKHLPHFMYHVSPWPVMGLELIVVNMLVCNSIKICLITIHL